MLWRTTLDRVRYPDLGHLDCPLVDLAGFGDDLAVTVFLCAAVALVSLTVACVSLTLVTPW